MFQALFCILGDRREQDKVPVSYGSELINGETNNSTSRQVNACVGQPTKRMLLRELTSNEKGSAVLLGCWAAGGSS